MTEKTIKEWVVCDICMQYIQNDDASSLDYYYSQEESNRRFSIMKNSLATAGGYPVVRVYPISNEIVVGEDMCECCHSSSDCVAKVAIRAKERDSNEYSLFCDYCGGKELQIKTWVHANTGKVLDEVPNQEPWCEDCESEVTMTYRLDRVHKYSKDQYEIVRHPAERFLFKVRLWETPTSATDLTPWVPKIDALRTIDEQFK